MHTHNNHHCFKIRTTKLAKAARVATQVEHAHHVAVSNKSRHKEHHRIACCLLLPNQTPLLPSYLREPSGLVENPPSAEPPSDQPKSHKAQRHAQAKAEAQAMLQTRGICRKTTNQGRKHANQPTTCNGTSKRVAV